MVPYDGLLRELAAELGMPVEHHHHPIPDLSVPRDPRDMVAILDRIDAALAAGRKVYVHCWGGTGRTGTVIGCYLVRHGLSGEEALKRVLELWQTMAKAPFKWRSPETDEQHDYVRQWRDERPIAGLTPQP